MGLKEGGLEVVCEFEEVEDEERGAHASLFCCCLSFPNKGRRPILLSTRTTSSRSSPLLLNQSLSSLPRNAPPSPSLPSLLPSRLAHAAFPFLRFIRTSKILWTPSTSLTTFPNSLPASSLTSSPSALLQALRTIDSQGVLFLTGVDATTEATEAVCRILGRGKLRNTHYDEFWDFTADMKMGDLVSTFLFFFCYQERNASSELTARSLRPLLFFQAYSNEPLRPHTDTTYFSSPCGLQIFHLLSHPSPPGTGGHTLLVDGFSCASQLRATHPVSYQILRDTKRQAHAAGSEGFLYRTEKGWGVFEEGEEGRLEGVRWNGEDRSVFSGGRVEEVERWYEAVRDWEGILRKKENEKWVKLTGGVVCGQFASPPLSLLPLFLSFSLTSFFSFCVRDSDRQPPSDARSVSVHGGEEDVWCLHRSGRVEESFGGFGEGGEERVEGRGRVGLLSRNLYEDRISFHWCLSGCGVGGEERRRGKAPTRLRRVGKKQAENRSSRPWLAVRISRKLSVR